MPEAESTAASSPGSETATVAVAEPVVTDNAGDSTSVDWDALSHEVDSDETTVTETTPVKEEVKPVATVTEPVKTETTPAAVTTAAVTEKPAVVTEPVVAVAPVAAVPAKTAEQIEADRVAAETASREGEEKMFNGLVEYYKLPEDLQLKLSTEPENVLPFLAARIHQSIARALTQTMQQVLPATIASVQSSQEREMTARTNFTKRWPMLAGKDEDVLRVGVLFRQLNPKATAEEAIEKIGRMTCETLGIPVEAEAAAAAVVIPAKPATGFIPAGGGGSGRGAAPASDNIFTQMADELLIEDAG